MACRQSLAAYEQMLRGVHGARGVFEASSGVSRESFGAFFGAYVDEMTLGTDLAGLRTLGYAPLNTDVVAGSSAPGKGATGVPATEPESVAGHAPVAFAAPGVDPLMRGLGYDRPLDNLAERRAAHIGWVFSGFGIGDLMSSLYGEDAQNLVIRIHDDRGR